MRPIKFRGKRKDDGEWVYGYLMQMHSPERLFIGEWVNLSNEARIKDELFLSYKEVLPETVGQFTGLKDKNGVEIYEGDIISTDIKRPYLIVEFRDGCFMLNCNDGGEDYYDIMFPILKTPQTAYKYGEIIGNIHERSET